MKKKSDSKLSFLVLVVNKVNHCDKACDSKLLVNS